MSPGDTGGPWGHGSKMSPCHSVSPCPLGTLDLGCPCVPWGHREPLGTQIRVAPCPLGTLGALRDTNLGGPVLLCVPTSPGDNRGPLGMQIQMAPCPLWTLEDSWGHGSKMSPCPLGTLGALGDTNPGGPVSLCVPMSPGDADLGCPHVSWGHWRPLGTRIQDDVPMSLCVPTSLGDMDLGCPHVLQGHQEPLGTQIWVALCHSVSPHLLGTQIRVAPCPLWTLEDSWGHRSLMSPCPLGTLGALRDTNPGGPMSLCVPMSLGDIGSGMSLCPLEASGALGDTNLRWPHVPCGHWEHLGTQTQDVPMSLCVPTSPGDMDPRCPHVPWGH